MTDARFLVTREDVLRLAGKPEAEPTLILVSKALFLELCTVSGAGDTHPLRADPDARRTAGTILYLSHTEADWPDGRAAIVYADGTRDDLELPQHLDYRALLVKFMAHLLDEEGYTFVERASTTPPSPQHVEQVQFTDAEIAALEAAEREAETYGNG